ncbi:MULTISPECIES: DUF2157 domain-containing protein [Marinobacter]|uniref:DUF2157 domain-containing protein n=1 Tax=Marinobacter segnicrescens TaxID=430453 RepID=A0A1I0GN80_9GAMM|nr:MULTISPECIES: DUF2157 domain-containing protein [Marinobacter]UZD65605.1 DUF2157 domain-containing protein [Marinobacter sp. AN1]SET72475.1 hypothetical protein SAMN04487962_11950 [Marinobacter segnicrescens]
MKITRKHLNDAVSEQILTSQQADRLYDFLGQQPGVGPAFNLTNVLYYLGGLIAIGAMTLFMNLGWEAFGGWGIFFISLLYAGVGLLLTGRFRSMDLAIPAGICATFVVALTPLAIYGLQLALGVWPDDSVYRDYHRYIRWHWLYMEMGTLAVGVVLAWIYRYSFMIMPIAVTLWYLSMDVAAMLMTGYYDFQFRALFSMYFGLLMTLTAFWVDFRSRSTADYAFWLYIFGVLTFWGGMTAQDSSSELSRFLYFSINLLMITIGVVIVRRVFVVFGALGVCFYLGHLAWEVFEDSWFFPMALTAIGLLIIYLGVLWQKNEEPISRKARSVLPAGLRELLAARSD